MFSSRAANRKNLSLILVNIMNRVPHTLGMNRQRTPRNVIPNEVPHFVGMIYFLLSVFDCTLKNAEDLFL